MVDQQISAQQAVKAVHGLSVAYRQSGVPGGQGVATEFGRLDRRDLFAPHQGVHAQSVTKGQAERRNEIGRDHGAVSGAVHREAQQHGAVIDADRHGGASPIHACRSKFGNGFLRPGDAAR
ncbi:hypothetical protein D3C85_1228950 [compost metagenome]